MTKKTIAKNPHMRYEWWSTVIITPGREETTINRQKRRPREKKQGVTKDFPGSERERGGRKKILGREEQWDCQFQKNDRGTEDQA